MPRTLGRRTRSVSSQKRSTPMRLEFLPPSSEERGTAREGGPRVPKGHTPRPRPKIQPGNRGSRRVRASPAEGHRQRLSRVARSTTSVGTSERAVTRKSPGLVTTSIAYEASPSYYGGREHQPLLGQIRSIDGPVQRVLHPPFRLLKARHRSSTIRSASGFPVLARPFPLHRRPGLTRSRGEKRPRRQSSNFRLATKSGIHRKLTSSQP